MRGFVCGMVVSVCFILGTGRAWHSTLPVTPPALAGQAQSAPAEPAPQPEPTRHRTELQPQVAQELLDLRRQLGGAWQAGQEGDAAFLNALKQVAEEANTATPASAAPRNLASAVTQQAHDQLAKICQNLLTLATRLRRNGQVQAADRLDAFETLLRGEIQNWATTRPVPEAADSILELAPSPQSQPAS
ncbi:MAG: hypothetical protein CMJ75_05465 [Planctomycetaceae bacterium]|nr:hypothetical protein [Planctomycetaceae bacterium]